MPEKLLRHVQVALTIAGSDSGGGAGVQADIKTFAALGVHPATAITCITAQNPKEISAIEPCRPGMVRAQIESVLAELPPAAIKIGMLYSASVVRVVVDTLKACAQLPIVIDPVMISTSRATLLDRAAQRILVRDLLPRASLLTPNLDEASALTGMRLGSIEDMRRAARWIQETFGCAALVKGGHLRGVKEATDVYYDGQVELLLTAPFIRGVSTHGTGCTYSAAITAFLAQGRTLRRSVELAKPYITAAVTNSYRIGRYQGLGAV